MKNLTLIALAFISLLTFGCTKDKQYVNCCFIPQNPSITAEKNSEMWIGTPEALKIDNDSIAITGRKTEQWLAMKIKFNGTGNYSLKGRQAIHYLTVGGDVTVAEYNLDDSATNTLDIIHYDSDKGIITGRFNITLKLDYHYNSNNYPATVKFEKGAFTQLLAK
jgi:hypothetical protein